MATISKPVRVASNPHRTGSRPNAAAKKGRNMAKAGTKKKAASGSAKHRSRKPNGSNHKKKRRSNRSRNPGISGVIGSPRDLLVGGFAGLASAVATRQLPQMILDVNNTGWQGYLANAATALAATWGLGALFGPAAGRGALVGGTVIVLDRVLSEQVSPIGPYLKLSGVGDANAYSNLGTIRTGYYTRPMLQNPDGSMYVPDPYSDAAVNTMLQRYPGIAAPPVVAGKMGAVNPSAMRRHTANGMLLSSRFQGRFNQ
jgi:hypothetical protein